MQGLTLVTPKTAPAVSLASVKDHLRITGTDEDTVLLGLIDAAEKYAELETSRAFIERTYRLTFSGFPFGSRDPIYLPMPPLSSVSSVKYWNNADPNVLTTVSDTTYTVETDYEPGTVQPNVGEDWPTDVADRNDAVEVVFVAGYANQSDIPAAISIAVKMIAGAFYENREETTTAKMGQVPEAISARRLLAGERVQRFF